MEDINGTSRESKTKNFFKEHKKQIIVGLIILAVGFGGPFLIFQIIKVALNTEYPFTVVLSESMSPTIERGDLLILQGKNPENIINGTVASKDGDIIVYDAHGVWDSWPRGSVPSEPIVHRVVGKYYDDSTDKWMFYTKGDNDLTNPDIDPPDGSLVIDYKYPVPEDKILGVVIGRIPWIGNISIFFSTSNIGIILIIVVGALLVITVIWDIVSPEEDEEEKEKKEAEKKLRKKMEKQRKEEAEKVSMQDEFEF